MEDAEFDVLDELYFVISYGDLFNNLDISEKILKEVLVKMVENGWLRIYNNMEEEAEEIDLINNFRSYFYLASKKGLLAHNRQ